MAQRGQVIDAGFERVEFLATAADTGGEYVAVRMTTQPGRPSPPAHLHPHAEERFRVESGTMAWFAGEARGTAVAGDAEVVVPAGTPHGFWNAGDDPLVVVGEARPALRMDSFVETIHTLIRDGHITPGRPVNPLRIAVVMDEYREEWRLARIPARALPAVRLLAAAGRALGYRGWYGDDPHGNRSRATAATL